MSNAARQLKKFLAPMHRRIALMVGRCVLGALNDSKGIQELQISALDDEELDRVERMQNYGFTGNPHGGAEGVFVCVGGGRNHSLVIALDDKRYRLTALKPGEVAIYDDLKQKIVLTRTGIEVETTQAEGVKITAPKVQVFTKIASIESTSVKVKASTVDIDCPTVKIKGNLSVSGEAMLGGGNKPVARVGDKIRLTSGDCSGATGVITTGAEKVTA